MIGEGIGGTRINLHYGGQHGLVFDVGVGDLVVVLLIEIVLLQVRKELDCPVGKVVGIGNRAVLLARAVVLMTLMAGRELCPAVVIVVQRQANLFQVVPANRPIGGLAGLLDGR